MCNLSDIWMLLLTSFIGGCGVTLLCCVLWAAQAMSPKREWDEHGDL